MDKFKAMFASFCILCISCNIVLSQDVLPKEIWLKIMECLPGNNAGLNYLSRIVGINEQIAQSIINEFVKSEEFYKLLINLNVRNINFSCSRDNNFLYLPEVIFKKHFSTFNSDALCSYGHSQDLIKNAFICNEYQVRLFNMALLIKVLDSVSQHISDNYIKNLDVQKVMFCRELLRFLFENYALELVRSISTEVYYRFIVGQSEIVRFLAQNDYEHDELRNNSCIKTLLFLGINKVCQKIYSQHRLMLKDKLSSELWELILFIQSIRA